ncbi:MAG TPA: ADOP family duplicated permease [Acidobacteriota bacterium]|nr:ADOP family duplicated permease [Acidobacteriota bacterium]
MLNDFSFALRMLRKSPLFTFAAVLTLTLGIGANTAIFSITHEVLGDLPYPDYERLVRLYTPDLEHRYRLDPSLPDLLDIRDRATRLEAIEAFYTRVAPLGDDGQRAVTVHSSSGFLSLIGARAHRGRLLSQSDWDANAPAAAVLSFEFWVSRYGGDDEAVGQVIGIGDRQYTIVGVAEPVMGPLLRRHDIFVPWSMEAQRASASRGARGGIRTLGKLGQGVSLSQAQAQLRVIGEELAQDYPESSGGVRPELVSLYDEIVGEAEPSLLALSGASLLILLIAVANIANLMLARGSRRRREMSIRSALGAGRLRLARLLLSEALLLSIFGGLAGLGAAWFLVKTFVASTPIHVPRLNEVGVDLEVILASLGVSILSGLLFGLAPLIFVRQVTSARGLSGSGSAADPGRLRGQSGLAVAQLALSLILLTGSGLMVRSFLALQSVPVGIDYEQIVVLSSGSLSVGHFPDRNQQLDQFNRILEGIEALPGVEAVTLTSQAPLSSSALAEDIEVLTGSNKGSSISCELIGVTGDFFQFFGSSALQGRLFRPQDRDFADSMVVVDSKLAERLWPEQPAVGQRLDFRGSEGEVIGVVEPIRYGDLAADFRPKMYTLQQHSRSAFGGTFLIRHQGDPEPVLAAVRSRVEEIDPSFRIAYLQPLEAFYQQWLVRPRFFLLLLGGLGVLALIVASVGVYGVMSYSVSRRLNEIGIRMALGARRANIFKLFYRTTAFQLAIGLTLGLLGALWLTPFLESLLFQIRPGDPLALLSTALVLSLAATLAILIPVRRAVRVDPARTLRE